MKPSGCLSDTHKSSENVPEEEAPHDDFTVPQKASHVTIWKDDNQYAVFCRIKDWNSGKRSHSFAIMTYATIPRV